MVREWEMLQIPCVHQHKQLFSQNSRSLTACATNHSESSENHIGENKVPSAASMKIWTVFLQQKGQTILIRNHGVKFWFCDDGKETRAWKFLINSVFAHDHLTDGYATTPYVGAACVHTLQGLQARFFNLWAHRFTTRRGKLTVIFFRGFKF
jgi:hypothetical protein